MATCEACGAAIEFVLTTKGAIMPIDALPDPTGNVRRTSRFDRYRSGGRMYSVVEVAQQRELFDPDEPRWMPHFATCSDPDRFRKRPPKGQGRRG